MPSCFSGDEIRLESLIDLDKYPIHDLQHPRRTELVEHCRAQLADDGCSVIEGLLLEASTTAMAAEATRLIPTAYRSTDQHNPYFTTPKDDSTVPEGFLQIRTSAYVVSDDVEADSVLRQLYDSDILLHFISQCVNVGSIYRWADTLARCPYGVMENDDYFPWHFDGNDFTVTMLVQAAMSGGIFEYIPNVRSPDMENAEKVMSILQGQTEGVNQLELKTGDMQLFRGRYSMHRVTHAAGPQPRIAAIPAYVTDPYKVTNLHHAKSLYGRVLPIHHERNLAHDDSLIG